VLFFSFFIFHHLRLFRLSVDCKLVSHQRQYLHVCRFSFDSNEKKQRELFCKIELFHRRQLANGLRRRKAEIVSLWHITLVGIIFVFWSEMWESSISLALILKGRVVNAGNVGIL
jgi:hypothetical protein